MNRSPIAEGTLLPTPLWLADPDYPAPCPCGRPMIPGEPMALVEGDHELKRLVHLSCLGLNIEEIDEQD